MFKYVATKIAVFAFDSATGLPKTGDATNISAAVSKDYGASATLATNTATEQSATLAPGWYTFNVAQAETNADALLFTAKSATTGIVVIGGGVIFTTPVNFTTLGIDTSGSAKVQSLFKKSTAFPNFQFVMTDSTTHNPVTGKTVTVTRTIDNGAASAGAIGTVTEIANGLYRVDLGAADLNGNVVTLTISATGCDTQFLTLNTVP